MQNQIQGIKIARGSLSFTHLLFADDLFIFAKATDQNLLNLFTILNEYLSWSGQGINRNKSSMFFSRNTSNQLRKHFCSLLNLKKGTANSKYLGLPLHIQRARTTAFSPILEKITGKLSSWKSIALSQARKGVLIRSVASAIPSYAMSMFLLPKTITNKLDSCFSNFWWGKIISGALRLHLRSWESICTPKSSVGLGIRKMHDQNLAVLAKKAWELMTTLEKPRHFMMQAKYLKHQSFLSHTPKSASSFFW